MTYELNIALEAIANFPISDPSNQDAINMQKIAKDALGPVSNLKVGNEVRVILGSLERTAKINSISGKLATLQVHRSEDRAGFLKSGIALSSLRLAQ